MTNVVPLGDFVSISDAWVSAATHLRNQRGHSCYNLIYSISKATELTAADSRLFDKYDEFARKVGIGTTATVANTIFPLDSYIKFKQGSFYERYLSEILPLVKTQWGTYFDRMICRRDLSGRPIAGKDGKAVNPLESMIQKLSKRIESGRSSKNHYEIPISDEGFELTTYLPEHDGNYRIGGPCLSHLSFKVDDDGAIRLTALYRSHYYLKRALGNLLGLARLQAYVALRVTAPCGPLTCIASYAYLESQIENANAHSVSNFMKECGLAA